MDQKSNKNISPTYNLYMNYVTTNSIVWHYLLIGRVGIYIIALVHLTLLWFLGKIWHLSYNGIKQKMFIVA